MPYTDLFFDLDHTLWDYDTSAKQTLSELYDRYGLSSFTTSTKEDLFTIFFEINDQLWDQYNKGEISKYVLRTERFKRVFSTMEMNKLFGHEHINSFADDYLMECPLKPNLIEGSIDVLSDLKKNYNLHIITNGFIEVQNTKIDKSGLTKFFKYVITSEQAGAKKPFSAIFEYAMKETNSKPIHSLMIGDNLSTDIKGAREFGMDQIYFNPSNIPHNEPVTHEIAYLTEILEILKA